LIEDYLTIWIPLVLWYPVPRLLWFCCTFLSSIRCVVACFFVSFGLCDYDCCWPVYWPLRFIWLKILATFVASRVWRVKI